MKLTFRAHPACFLCLLAAMIRMKSDALLATIAALVLHEGAHMAAMWLCRVKSCTVEITPFGGVADVNGFEALSGWKQAAIALSGVLGSAALACLCFYLSPMTGFWHYLYNANLTMALFNCLPLWPLDGARVMLALGRHFGIERMLANAMLMLSYALGAAMVALGFYGAWNGCVNLSLFLSGPYLAYAAHESARFSRVRGMERFFSQKTGLENGALKAAQTYVCLGKPTILQLTRLMNRTPEQRYGLLTVLDDKNGKIIHTLSQKEMANQLLGKEP